MSFNGSTLFAMLTDRERKMLENSWCKPFADEIFPAIDESRFACLYPDGDMKADAPINVIVGALILKEHLGLTDSEAASNMVLDVRWPYALRTTSLEEQPILFEALPTLRTRLLEHEEQTGEDLMGECLTELAARVDASESTHSRIKDFDFEQIASNMRTLMRVEPLMDSMIAACVLLVERLKGACPDCFADYASPNCRTAFFWHRRRGTYEDKLRMLFFDVEALIAEHADDLEGTEELAALKRSLSERTVVEGNVRRLRER